MTFMNITLPDGSVKELPKGSTGLDIAKNHWPWIGKSSGRYHSKWYSKRLK